jgi:hypothetical protein
VLYLLGRHDEIELLRIVAGVFEAHGLQFAAGQVRRAVARIEQGADHLRAEGRWPAAKNQQGKRPPKMRS